MRCKAIETHPLIQAFQPKFATITLTTPTTPPIVLWKSLLAAGHNAYVALDFRVCALASSAPPSPTLVARARRLRNQIISRQTGSPIQEAICI